MPATEPPALAPSGDAFDPEAVEEILAQLNGEDDAVVALARKATGAESILDARVLGIDAEGIDLEVRAGAVADPNAATTTHRVTYAAPAATVDELRLQVAATAYEAMRLTSDALAKFRTYLTAVARTERVGARCTRVTLVGGDLDTFRSPGWDAFAYLLLPPSGRDQLTIDQTFTWEAFAEMGDDVRPVGAYYTIRRWRPEGPSGLAEVDLDVVHHDGGNVTPWVESNPPAGFPVALWGPRTAWKPPAGTDGYLLVADETGVPALAAILEALPDEAPVRAVIEVADAQDVVALPERPSVEVRWSFRPSGLAAGEGSGLLDAVRAVEIPGRSPYVWGGGESRQVTAVRKHVRRERGLTLPQVSLLAYWRRT